MSADELIEPIKTLIIDTLMLEDITAEEMEPDAPLFSDEGLGLDSIDALELGMAVSKKFKIKLSQDPDANREHFESVASLAAFVSRKVAEGGAS
ncbi:phosphopantetheine-binding protein [Acanthopleuribacter pedis]|uniref:Acyl carrier protein n=1 Tax=Acanthopleuribacter pedis TaxID=442870 RepID=A0A8J7QHZ5_9BACT|nr:phosphopantetheine-binding protein [Acanthopleuribacter pedis]MBO1320660.1 acyl carrier protein [Acanthopleuribacter pedis]